MCRKLILSTEKALHLWHGKIHFKEMTIMRKILSGTASVLAASTLLLGSANESHAALGDALTPAATDYDFTTVFGSKATAAGMKAFVTSLNAAQSATAGTIGIKGFSNTGATEGLTIPKAVDTTANILGAVATKWNVPSTTVFTGRIPLVATPQTTFLAAQWQQVKITSCAVGVYARAYTISTADPSLYTAADTFGVAVATAAAPIPTYDNALDGAATAAAATGTTFFSTVIPATLAAAASGAAAAIGSMGATFNIFIKPTVAAPAVTSVPSTQYLEYIVSCFGVYRATS